MKMTQAEIRAMFVPGEIWIGKRTPGFNGTAVAETRRTVERVLSAQIVFEIDGKANYWTALPRQCDVIEARPGYLRYRSAASFAHPFEVELVREGGADGSR